MSESFDYKKIGAFLIKTGLMEKPISEFSIHDIHKMCQFIVAEATSFPEGGYTPPYVNEKGDLIIPLNADPRHRYWQGGIPLKETLKEMGFKEGDPTFERYCPKYLEEGIIPGKGKNS